LLDCGLKFHEGGFDYPAKVFESRALDGVFLSHAHLDHAGGLPFFVHYHMRCPIYCTQETDEITRILLRDSQRVAHLKRLHEAFTKSDMQDALGMLTHVRYNEETRLRSISYAFLNAGHIPGSAAVRIRAEGLSLVYSGDYNTETTRMMMAADPTTWGKTDILITESTYAEREHPDREKTEKEFLEHIERVTRAGGRVLIPVFAVGRAQEVLLMLSRKQWSVPVYIDGLARKVTAAIIDGPCPYATSKQQLRASLRVAKPIGSLNQRVEAAEQSGIFVTTSGMLQGGPAMYYLQEMWSDPKSAVLLTGFQVHNTPGWHLSEEHIIKLDGQRHEVQCQVKRYDFSAHLSRTGLQQTILALKPRILIFMHGDPSSTKALADWAHQAVGATVYSPAVGEQIDIDPNGVSSSLQLYKAQDGYEFPPEHNHAIRFAYDDAQRTDENGS